MVDTGAHAQALRLSTIVAAFAFCLLIVAGIDLGANGINAIPSLSTPTTAIGSVHLTVALLTAIATGALCTLSSLQLRSHTRAFRSAIFASVLIAVKLTVILVPWSATGTSWATAVHFGATALLLATALSLAVPRTAGAQLFRATARRSDAMLSVLTRVISLTAISVFAVLVSGAYLGASSAPTTCSGWPLCSTPGAGISLLEAQNSHRLLVALSGLLLIASVALLMRAGSRRIVPVALLSVFVAEAFVGAFSAGNGDSLLVSATHFAAAGAAWSMLVLAGLAVYPLASLRPPATKAPASIRTAAVRDYLRVTKPGIMVLLLITTLGAMLVAPGWPTLGLVLATLLGGALASGGASALNCYLDRDIDVVMARTRRRPLPTGSLSSHQVLTFGLLLSTLAVVELWLLVNPVAALLALSGNVFYVVIYTRFLKRATPQNIVIGGAAGAFPPLVGWAAVTGTISLTSILLFALIYYWTPPHFWSLALLKARDYERAAIPMLPVTHGDHQTRRHILLYSYMLVAITLLLVPAGAAGLFYLAVAVILGIGFVGLAARMYREGTSRLAWRLFKYSNYYLAAILLAMVVDRAFTG